MKCSICGCNNTELIYNDHIRRGAFGNMTEYKVPMYQCLDCGIIWHEKLNDDMEKYYSSAQNRNEMCEGENPYSYYELHDREVIEKLNYTGTDLFRNKIVMDIGCGGGSFIDYLYGVAAVTIGIEPTEAYRKQMLKKGHQTYSYAEEALLKFKGKVDVITSFDVIEHVDDPLKFLVTAQELLNDNGKIIIGTPSEHPIMRKLLGEEYDSFLFSFQHPWIFSKKSYQFIANKAGFNNIKIINKQRYGWSNSIAWLKNHRPMGNIRYDYVDELMETVWIKEAENREQGDYLILYAEK